MGQFPGWLGCSGPGGAAAAGWPAGEHRRVRSPLRRLVTLASRPHRAVIAAMVRLLPHPTRQTGCGRPGRQASLVEPVRGVHRVEHAHADEQAGLDGPSPVTRPAAPGRTNASPMGQQARSVPAVRITACRPYRATRTAGQPGADGCRPRTVRRTPGRTATARTRRWPSMRTEMSGSTAMIRPPTRIWLKNNRAQHRVGQDVPPPVGQVARARGPGWPGEPAAALRTGRDSLPADRGNSRPPTAGS